MKKTALVLGSLLVLCVLVSPKIVGYKITSSINDAVEAINDVPGYSAETTTIESGWFTTTANIRLAVDASVLANVVDVQKDTSPVLQIVLDASHGPVLGGENGGLGWAVWSVDVTGDSLREFLDWEQGASLYRMEGSAGLLGKVNYSHVIPAFTAETAIESTLVKFSGHQGNYNGSELSYNSGGNSDITITAPQGTISVSFDANLIGAKPFPESLNDVLEHGLMTAKVQGDKAAIEFILESVLEKDFESYEFPRNMTKEEIKAKAIYKRQFVLAVLNMQRLLNVTDTHYSAAINLENNQLTIHKKTILL